MGLWLRDLKNSTFKFILVRTFTTQIYTFNFGTQFHHSEIPYLHYDYTNVFTEGPGGLI